MPSSRVVSWSDLGNISYPSVTRLDIEACMNQGLKRLKTIYRLRSSPAIVKNPLVLSPRARHSLVQQSSFNHRLTSSSRFQSTMSAAAHPIHSTSQPAKPAEGLEPVTPGASATPAPSAANGDAKAPAAAPAGGKDKGEKAKAPKEKKDKKAGGGSSGPLELSPPPEYFQERIKIFDEYKAKYVQWVSGE